MKIFTDLTKNVEFLKKELPSSDVNFRSVKAGDKDGYIIFVKDMTDVKGVGNLIITPLHELKGEVSDKTVSDALYSPEKKADGRYERFDFRNSKRQHRAYYRRIFHGVFFRT